MRFSIWRFFLVFSWFGVVLAAFCTTGLFYSARILGVLSGMSLYFFDQLAVQWRCLRKLELTFLAIALSACLAGTAFGFGQMVQDSRAFTIESENLQARIHEDSRFQNVTATYSGSIGHRILTVSGTVSSQKDENALREMGRFWGFKTDVRWLVYIDARTDSVTDSH